jgi:ABC-2 type transport system permease protein
MNSASNSVTNPNERDTTPFRLTSTRPFFWSVRRELWEHRSLYLAPLGIAGAVLLGFVFYLFHLPYAMRSLPSLDPAHQRATLAQPFDFAAGAIMAAAFLVSIFYSVDALYGERRDRGILFWKSMPVSDLTTVLAKATIPLFVLPLIAFAVTAVTEFIMLFLSSFVVLINGLGVATLWTQLQLHQVMILLLYHIVTAHMLWYAPFYAWLLLVSAWARRAPFLWGVLPPLAVIAFESIAFHSSNFLVLINDRYAGNSDAMTSMMGDFPFHPGMHLDPGAFLAAPGLWTGLVLAAIFLAAAVRLRHYREPI